MKRDTRHQLEVDIRRCDAYGYCAEMLPESIARDEWGYPIVTGAIDPGRVAQARRVVDACPMLALRLRAVKGRSTATQAR
jgi:ferredoxin